MTFRLLGREIDGSADFGCFSFGSFFLIWFLYLSQHITTEFDEIVV